MKKIRILIFCVIYSTGVFAQNTATNFVTDDCSGVTHNLFDTLNAGNVVVIAWVMPCGPCATYAYFAYSAVQYLEPSFPGKIDFYLVDDFANTSCANLVGWGNTNNMPLNTTFSSSDISMSDYGSNGMPKVVVLSGSDHSVFYNVNNNEINYNDVLDALLTALSPPSSVGEKKNNLIDLNCFPNPATNVLNIYYNQTDSDKIVFEVTDLLGGIVLSSIYYESSNSENKFHKIDISALDNGLYFLTANSNSNQKTISFFVE